MSNWVLITGAAKRIGREIALEMARAGWDIIVHYNTSKHDALKTSKEIQKLGRKTCLAELDLSNAWLVGRLIPELAKELGPIGGLINNASLFLPDRLDKNSLHEKINAEAPWILGEAFYRQTPPKHEGIIVNLLDADPTKPEFSHYNESKNLLGVMTLRMAAHFAPRVRVNGVALGPVMRGTRESAKHFRQAIQNIPLNRAIAVEDVTRSVRFLMENKSMTGSMIALDGGAHLIKG